MKPYANTSTNTVDKIHMYNPCSYR